MTELDQAHQAMTDAPENDAARLRFYARLADTEVFLLLAGEPEGDKIAPEVFEIADGKFALIFDTEDRLTDFTGRPSPYAGLPARALAGMLGGQGIGLGLNLQVAPSEMLIPAEAVDWLVETLGHTPDEAEARLTGITAHRVPETVLAALGEKLSRIVGLADYALLAGATYEGGGTGHVLAFVGADEAAHAPLAHAAGEALRFSGIEAGQIDVMFTTEGDALTERLARTGARFDLPKPQMRPDPIAPGSDPSKPPKLV